MKEAAMKKTIGANARAELVYAIGERYRSASRQDRERISGAGEDLDRFMAPFFRAEEEDRDSSSSL